MSDRSVIDLNWRRRPGLIAAWRYGDVLVDCGPHTCLDSLLEGLGDWRPQALLLTHIHFDHAGAAGDLVALWPDLQIWVHQRGARHLAEPSRLEASARRVFGDEFDVRFGPMKPVPEANIHALEGGETVHGLTAEATPGHAQHHLAYFDDDGSAFTGDVAGVRLGGDGPVFLPTPPPDVDLEAWAASVELIAARGPARLLLPHFGQVDEVDAHLEAAREAVGRQAELAALDQSAYVLAVRKELAPRMDQEGLNDYETVVPLDQNHVGIRRWADKMQSAQIEDR